VDLSDRFGEIGDRRVRDSLLNTADSIARSLGAPGLVAQVRCDRADNLRTEGKYDDARAALAPVDALLARAADPSVTVDCLEARGNLNVETGRSDQAAADFRSGLAIKERLGETRDATYFDLLNGLGAAQDDAGHPRDALVTLTRAMGGMDSSGRGGMLSRAIMLHDAAVVLVRLGETADAERAFHDVLVRAAAADRQGRIDWQPLIHYAETALTQGDADSARKYFAAIVARADAEASQYWQGRGLYGLARAEFALGETGAARASAARFGAIARSFPGVKSTDDVLPDTMLLAGLAALANRRPAAAQASFLGGLRANGYYEGKRLIRLRPVVLLVAGTALALGQPDTALVYARAAGTAAAVDSLAGERSGWVGQARIIEARARLALGDTSAARAAAAAAARALATGMGADHPRTREAQAFLASLQFPTR
jgi:tetratricopeptide (TPR) repeat protein